MAPKKGNAIADEWRTLRDPLVSLSSCVLTRTSGSLRVAKKAFNNDLPYLVSWFRSQNEKYWLNIQLSLSRLLRS
jgi:hypothetical protein